MKNKGVKKESNNNHSYFYGKTFHMPIRDTQKPRTDVAMQSESRTVFAVCCPRVPESFLLLAEQLILCDLINVGKSASVSWGKKTNLTRPWDFHNNSRILRICAEICFFHAFVSSDLDFPSNRCLVMYREQVIFPFHSSSEVSIPFPRHFMQITVRHDPDKM